MTCLKEDNQKLTRQMSDISNHVQKIMEGSTYSRGKRASISTAEVETANQDDIDRIHMILFVKDRFNVSGEAYIIRWRRCAKQCPDTIS